MSNNNKPLRRLQSGTQQQQLFSVTTTQCLLLVNLIVMMSVPAWIHWTSSEKIFFPLGVRHMPFTSPWLISLRQIRIKDNWCLWMMVESEAQTPTAFTLFIPERGNVIFTRSVNQQLRPIKWLLRGVCRDVLKTINCARGQAVLGLNAALGVITMIPSTSNDWVCIHAAMWSRSNSLRLDFSMGLVMIRWVIVCYWRRRQQQQQQQQQQLMIANYYSYTSFQSSIASSFQMENAIPSK